MVFKSTIHLAVLLYLSNSVVSRKLPSFVKICERNSPNFNGCLKASAEAIRPHLANGIPEMRIPVLEPLRIPHVELDTGASFKATFNNVRLYGLTNFVIRDIDLNFDENFVKLDLFLPLVQGIADYELKGRILILQLNGSGKCMGNYTNLQVRTEISGSRIVKKGKEFVDFNKISLDLQFGERNSLVFEDIFRGNKELSDQTNKILSENVQAIMMEIKPVFHETVSQLVLGLLKGVFGRFSLEDLFPAS